MLPITSLLRKGQQFRWTPAAQNAFERLKSLFTNAPVLRHFDPELPITLFTDSSGFALSGIICQLFNNHLHPIAFWSRKCSPAECNYDIHDREMLAIIESMKHWRHYLEGSKHPIKICTDHKNLETFMTTKVLNRRQARWAEFLSAYDFVLVPIPGSKNPADGPSRRPDYAQDIELPSGTLIPKSALRLLNPSDPTPSTSQEIVSTISTSLEPSVTLMQRIIEALSHDSLAAGQRENPQPPWS